MNEIVEIIQVVGNYGVPTLLCMTMLLIYRKDIKHMSKTLEQTTDTLEKNTLVLEGVLNGMKKEGVI